MQLRPDGAEPLYMQLKTILASQIDRGELQPHQKLPSERELCRTFGISRMTVRHALNTMAQGGLVYTQPGKGNPKWLDSFWGTEEDSDNV